VILQNPQHQNLSQWTSEAANYENQIELAINRVVSGTENAEFKAIRFVPKQLNLQDPRSHGNRELVSHFGQAKNPGLNGYEQHCLYYVQQLQHRWWNAGHQRYSGTDEEREIALNDYDSFQAMLSIMLGCPLDRNLDGDATLFGRPIPDAGLSDGQKVILQLCVALHAQRSQLDSTVFLMDEPENHLHPSSVIDLLKSLYEITGKSQIWIATHSIPLLAYVASVEPMSLWYVEDGLVTNSGRHPETVLSGLLGDEERIGQLNAFTGLPAQLAAINYATESLFPPKVVAEGDSDPQVTQIQEVVAHLSNGAVLSVLDYGAGKGRLLDGFAANAIAAGMKASELLDYFAFDPYPDNHAECVRLIGEHFPVEFPRYFNSREEFFDCKADGSIDVVVMCNVFHEISPREWLNLLSPNSLIVRALKDNGYLLIVEDLRIPVGEKAHDHGFLVLDTSHLRTLFSICEDDLNAGHFSHEDSRKDGRLKAHLIAKPLLSRITSESRRIAIEQLKETAKEQIRNLRNLRPSYVNGQLNGFWTQQFANSSLYLDET
jgi:SAM-dependent methyltransferase